MNTEINVTNEIINVDTTTSVIDVNVTNEIIVIEATQGAYPLPATVYSVFGRTGDIVALNGDYSTSLVTEGTNLYFTTARARGSLSAGTGIGYSSLTGVISNTAPDQTVTLTSGSGIGITGTYPSFTIASTITQYTDALARAAISLTTIGTSGAATYSPLTGVLNIPQYAPDLSGYVPTSRTLTINGTTYDLSANRSWEITSMIYPSAGIAVSTGTAWGTSITNNSANWNTAYNRSIVSAAVTGTTTKTLTLNEQDGSTITASWTDINTDAVTSVFGRTGAVVATEGDYALTQLGDVTITTPSSGQVLKYNGTTWVNGTDTDTGLTSVGVSMPVAFNVANSPLIANGTIAVTAAGTATQYIRGDGQLATFPTTGGGGSAVYYYLNGSIPSSVAGYEQMANTAVIGTGTDFNLTGNGLIAQFLTDAGNPNRTLIPSGAWNFEMFFNSSSSGGNPKFYLELVKYNGSTFTIIASSSANPEAITGGTATDLYITSIAVPETTLLITDRLAVRVYIVDNSGGRTITLHTEDSNLCQVTTTFSAGISSLNGLNANTQYLAVGTAGSDFNINSLVDTHTFNLPTASATKRGALNSSDWSVFNSKQNAITLTTTGTSGVATLTGSTLNIPNYSTDLSGYVPYTGATGSVTLGAYSITASSLIKSGGTSAEILAADGSVITAGTNITISGGTISASGGGGSMAIGGSITSATAGSVLFAGAAGVLAQDNANFFWDDTNNRLGIGTATPGVDLLVKKAATTKIGIESSGTATVETLYLQNTTDTHYVEFTNFGTTSGDTKFGLSTNGSSGLFFYPKTTGYGMVGTNTSAPLVIGTNNIEAIRINTSQQIGLGTSTIGSKLQVNGNAAIGYSASTAAPTNGLIVAGDIQIGATKSFLGTAGSYFYIGYIAANGPNINMSSPTRGGGPYFISYDHDGGHRFSNSNESSVWMTINSSGNLGLGTTTFGASKFQINGNAAIGYSASTAAPTNGLVVSGIVGIGTTTTKAYSSLTVQGQIVANSNFCINSGQSLRMNMYYNSGTVTDRAMSTGYSGDFILNNGTGDWQIRTTSATASADTNITTMTTRLTIAATGAATFNSSVTSTQYRLSALNTAPATTTSTGTLGEIRIDAGAIYVCTATNTWVRALLTTF